MVMPDNKEILLVNSKIEELNKEKKQVKEKMKNEIFENYVNLIFEKREYITKNDLSNVLNNILYDINIIDRF